MRIFTLDNVGWIIFGVLFCLSVSIQILRPKWAKRLFSSGGDAGPGGDHGADGCGDGGCGDGGGH
jgi:hypothetical protein